MKKIAVILLSLAFGSTAYADNDTSSTKSFLGLEIGLTSVQGDTYSEARHESTGAEFGLRLGAQSEEWRTIFVLNYYDNVDEDQNKETLQLAIDYFFAGDTLDIAFKPFIGVNAGYTNYESTGIDSSDFSYGGQVGFVSSVTESIDVDLSYRYSLSSSESLSNMGSLVLGFNYFY
jgi:opacity protein-like surface antigen